MKTRLLGAVYACLLLPLQALAISIVSGDGTETCIQGPALGGGGTCNVQTISPAAEWEQNNPGGSSAVWISYADTGRPGTVTAPIGLVATFTETFSIGAGATLDLEVWADNTAGVFIDGVSVFDPNFAEDSVCAAGPIGCQSGEQGIIQYIFQTSGQHTLSFDVYQSGTLEAPPGNPFGLMYAGTLTAIPIPPAIWLFASGLIGLVGMARCKA